jgi:hypothetical protein
MPRGGEKGSGGRAREEEEREGGEREEEKTNYLSRLKKNIF